ncbi:MAG: glycosyltransferase family 2 protein [Fibrobacter sp.]|nr:glycosyltransferase family 2 protein [Fibrobacter sp.]
MENGVDILMITHKRPQYTKITLEKLLNSCDEKSRVWIWQNGNYKETLDVVDSFKGHKNFYRFHHSSKNEKLNTPTNWLWSNAKGDFLGKVDDDCIVPRDWIKTLLNAHLDNPYFGVIGCWHFLKEDYREEIAAWKIKQFSNGHRLMVNCWLGGSGYIMKKKCIDLLGPIKKNKSFTSYCIDISLKGFINGWYYPFIYQKHLDDPRVEESLLKTDEDIRKWAPLSVINNGVTTLQDWKNHLIYRAHKLQEEPIDPIRYLKFSKYLSMIYRIYYYKKLRIWNNL